MYVPGFDRGVRPIGDWSIAIILSRCSSPVISRCFPGSPFPPLRSRRSDFDQNIVNKRTLSAPRNAGHADKRRRAGIATSTFFRLLCVGAVDGEHAEFLIVSPSFRNPQSEFRNRSYASPAPRSSAFRSKTPPSRSCVSSPVGRPCRSPTTSPPRTPGPGPKSIRWSAARIVSSSCSTTTTVFPWSRSCSSDRSSADCRGHAGRSTARRECTSTPTNPQPICPARRIRCDSPPESVGAVRSSVK